MLKIKEKIVEEVKTTKISSIEIKDCTVILNKSARIQVILYNEKKNIVAIKNVELKGEDYKLWGADDTFIENFVLQQLNYEKQ